MPSKLVARGALMCIGGYQRYLSPYKGYRCAYHAATGRASCSRHAQRVIDRAGVWYGLRLLHRRFERCALAAAALAEQKTTSEDPTFFGRCDPAVREFRKLYCGGCLGGILESMGD